MKQALFLALFLLKAAAPAAAQTAIFFNEKEASPIERAAVETLRSYLEKMTGQPVRSVGAGQPRPGTRAVFINNNEFLSDFGLKMPKGLPPGGFFVESKNNAALLAAADGEGLERAVFTFLEKLGCRKFSPRDSIVPRLEKGQPLPKILPQTGRPAFAWRELHYQNAFDEDWARWHGLTRHSQKKKEWGLFVHTFDRLCPARLFFEKNPDWFTFNGAQRVADGQLCLTNPAVLEQVVAALRDSMSKRPEARYWSVSQNDNFNHCKCDRCRASDEKLGGPSGTMVAFVNEVAAQFPDKTISTLAYQYTRAAPKGIRPAPNVNIMFCSIECNRGLPIAEDPSSASFVRDFEGWAALTGNIYLWDYVVDFRSYQMPFPNLHVLQPNLLFFQKMRPTMVFEQGSGRDRSEMSDLRAYLLAKWLWDPSLGRDSLMGEFLEGVYGAAAPFLKKYIDRREARLAATDGQLWIYAVPAFYQKTYLSEDDLVFYERLFDKAEKAVAEGSRQWQRVREARLPLMFARLELAKLREPGLWEEKKGELRPSPRMAALLTEFTQGCESHGIENLHEGGYRPREHERDLRLFMENGKQEHLAARLPVALKEAASKSYAGGDAAVLTDRFLGETDYHFNWLGFEGRDMEAVISFPKMTEISFLEVHFLQDQQSWVFFPEKVRFELSADGRDWEPVFEQELETKPDGSKKVATVKTHLPEPKSARLVRIRAESRKSCPPWHACNGSPCWVFCDEAIVR